MVGTLVSQCVERIQADHVRPQIGGRPVHDLREIAEIPGAPVPRRSQCIELNHQPPAAHAGLELNRHVAGIRRHDETQLPFHLDTRTVPPGKEIVVAEREPGRDGDVQADVAAPFDRPTVPDRDPGPHGALLLRAAPLIAQLPPDAQLFFVALRGRHTDRPGPLRPSIPHDEHGLTGCQPDTLFAGGQLRVEGVAILRAQAHRLQNRALGVRGQDMALPPIVMVLGGDAVPLGQRIQQDLFRLLFHHRPV